MFGPKPRDYARSIPKKMRQQAIRCVLSTKALGGTIKVLDEITFDVPKTRVMGDMLKALNVGSKSIIAVQESNPNITKSARNIPGVITMPARQLNVADMLSHETLIITEAAVREIEQLWGGAA